MDIKRNGSQPSSKGPAEYFTGTVRIDPLFEAPDPARARGASVTFEPGARSAWHTNPVGQTLIVTSGCGWVQSEGDPKMEERREKQEEEKKRNLEDWINVQDKSIFRCQCGIAAGIYHNRAARFERTRCTDEIFFCGICHSDVHQVRNEWSSVMPTTYPLVPGREIVGRNEVGQRIK